MTSKPSSSQLDNGQRFHSVLLCLRQIFLPAQVFHSFGGKIEIEDAHFVFSAEK